MLLTLETEILICHLKRISGFPSRRILKWLRCTYLPLYGPKYWN